MTEVWNISLSVEFQYKNLLAEKGMSCSDSVGWDATSLYKFAMATQMRSLYR